MCAKNINEGETSYLDGSKGEHQNFSALVPSPYDRSYGDSKRARKLSPGQEHLLQHPPNGNLEARATGNVTPCAPNG